MDRASLEGAYRRTTYRAGDIALRIDEPHPALDLLLADRELDAWAYLTAYNPRSTPLAPAANRARQAELLARLADHSTILGDATSDTGDWEPEPSVLVLGIERAEAKALARMFEQNAILVGRRGRLVELVWCEP